MFKDRPTIREVLLSSPTSRPSRDRETAFWSALRLQNGVFKLTFRDRFSDVNAWVVDHLPSDRPLQVMDVAASSGITSLEFSQFLDGLGIDHEVVSGDLSATCWLVKTPIGEVLLERSGYPLQYDLLQRKAIPSTPGTRSGFTTYRALRLVTRLLIKRPSVRRRLAGDRDFSAYGFEFNVQPLMMPEVVESDAIEIVTDDILAPTPSALRDRFHFIRAANILNPDYFDDATLVGIVKRLRERLVDDGQLLIVKTQRHGDDDGVNNGTLVKKVEDGWDVVARIGDGSPIDSLVGL